MTIHWWCLVQLFLVTVRNNPRITTDGKPTFNRIMSISEYFMPRIKTGTNLPMCAVNTSRHIGSSASDSQNSHASSATESSASCVRSNMNCSTTRQQHGNSRNMSAIFSQGRAFCVSKICCSLACQSQLQSVQHPRESNHHGRPPVGIAWSSCSSMQGLQGEGRGLC